MVTRTELQEYLHQLLLPEKFRDYVPNGLQVEGKASIQRLITGVTACQNLLEKAVEYRADAILVHHGYFWSAENACLTGIKYRRLKTLFLHDINLFAYHLPLDVHPLYGNNVQLAKKLAFDIIAELPTNTTPNLGLVGKLQVPITADEFTAYLQQHLQQLPLHIGKTDKIVKTIAWSTGAAQDFLQAAIEAKVDAYLTGEVSERTVHLAREADIQFYAAGHHATERYGVQALGEHLAEYFHLEHQFIDIENPV